MDIDESVVNKKSYDRGLSLLTDLINIHGDRYDYSNSTYYGMHKKMAIKCPEHGVFNQTPEKHVAGQRCPLCSIKDSADKLRMTKSEFIEKSREVHGDKYDYSWVVYKTNHDKVIILCNTHGAFAQRPSQHINGHRCRECVNESTSNALRSSSDEFIKKAKAIHGGEYDYSEVTYHRALDKVSIICKEHGEFKQRPNTHLMGKGCPSCSTKGFKINKAATLYYLKIDGGEAYKIGITNRSVNERFSNKDLEIIEVLETWKYPIGKDALDKEQEILRMYKNHKYEGELLESGNTELFTFDVLGLDIK